VDSKVPKQLKKFLKKHCDDKLAVVDAKLGKVIAEKLGLKVVSGTEIMELTRGIRSQLEGLIVSLERQTMTQMSLGLSHSLSRYKLKFSPDKVDTMVVQAIGLLDDLDKELNTYAMRVREWCASAAVLSSPPCAAAPLRLDSKKNWFAGVKPRGGACNGTGACSPRPAHSELLLTRLTVVQGERLHAPSPNARLIR
jgi:hypothetical protein